MRRLGRKSKLASLTVIPNGMEGVSRCYVSTIFAVAGMGSVDFDALYERVLATPSRVETLP
jgi:hypothetical protein